MGINPSAAPTGREQADLRPTSSDRTTQAQTHTDRDSGIAESKVKEADETSVEPKKRRGSVTMGTGGKNNGAAPARRGSIVIGGKGGGAMGPAASTKNPTEDKDKGEESSSGSDADDEGEDSSNEDEEEENPGM